MLALTNRYISGPKISGVSGEAIQGDPMQIEYHRRSKPERTNASRDIIDHRQHAIELSNRIFRLPTSDLIGVVNQSCISRNAMPLLFTHLANLSNFFGGGIDHFSRYSVILDMCIAVSKASALSFLLGSRHRFTPGGFDQLCQIFAHL